MSEIIGHDTDGTPVPAGALVRQVEGSPKYLGTQYKVVEPVDELMQRAIKMLYGLESPVWAEDGLWVDTTHVRLVKGDHRPADKEFTEQLKQMLKQEDKQCQN